MAAGAQNLLLALAVPLISPFELQHQIFREHPAPEQLFLIATPQHCCPCLYINIYSEPRTEHQSSALPPPPALAGPAPPPAPALPLQALAGQEGGCAETDLGPTVLLLLHRFGWTRPCPVPPPAPCSLRGAGRRESSPRSPRSCPQLQQRPELFPRRCSPAAPHRHGPDSPASPLPRHRLTDRGLSLWRCSTMVWRRQRVGAALWGQVLEHNKAVRAGALT